MTRLIIVYLSFIVISLMLMGISSAKIDPKTAAGICKKQRTPSA